METCLGIRHGVGFSRVMLSSRVRDSMPTKFNCKAISKASITYENKDIFGYSPSEVNEWVPCVLFLRNILEGML